MSSVLKSTIPEIRINNLYASLLNSEYKGNKKGESVPFSRTKTVMTDTLMKKILTNEQQEAGMLPPNCRYLQKYTNGTIAVIEVPPAVRTIAVDMNFDKVLDRLQESGKLDEYGYNYKDEMDAQRPYMFTLAIPFTIFILTMNNNFEVTGGQVYFRTKEISGLGDYLLKAPFSNISDGGFICFGDKIYNKAKSIYSATIHAQNVWWGTIFNSDYTYNLEAYNKTPGLCDYFTWQYLSHTNPLFIYNAKWLRIATKLGERLSYTRQGANLEDHRSSPYSILVSAFTKRAPTGEIKKPFKRARKQLPLYYDMAQGVFLTNRVCAHVGDAFLYNKKKELAHIDNFIGFLDASEPHTIRINKNGKLIRMRMTEKVKSYIAKKVTQYTSRASIEINGKVIKKGEILIFKNTSGYEVYKKVKLIRQAVDGLMELHVGVEYYLSDNLPEFEKYDPSSVKLYGREITKDDEYILLRDSGSKVPLYPGARVKYTGADIDRNDQLNFKFANTSSPNNYNIVSTNVQKSRLIDPESVEEVKGIFRVGRSLYYNSKESSAPLWKTPYGYIKDSEATLQNPGFQEVKEQLLKDDELSIQSFDLDISFKIGDKVVVADWRNPLNMLSSKVIQGFKTDDNDSSISLILQDKHEKLSSYIYIQSNVVKVGTVRKISNIHKGIKVGTKIIAKEAGIPCFPKKDANIIIGFITDTGVDEPLVLCSNCCTLWFDDMMDKFERVTIRARKWKEIPHADIDLSKIKFQAGDLVEATGDYGNSHGYVLYCDDPKYDSLQMKAHSLSYYIQHSEYFYLDRRLMKELKFDSIISPRIKSISTDRVKSSPCFPNFHGAYSIVSPHLSDFYFPQQLGRMIDVSDFYK